MTTLQDQIINQMVFSEDFCRKVLPFTKFEYFEDHSHQVIVREILDYFGKYNKTITKEILEVSVLARTDITQEEAKSIPKYIENIKPVETNTEWLIEQSEKLYQKRAVYLAILDSIQIIEGSDKKRSEDVIPTLLSDALSVSFDSYIGHDYFNNSADRYDFYHTKEDGIPFDIDVLNKITGGVGLRKKTLTAIAARSGGGKSIGLCHIAASTLKQGKNVLYITLEMSEHRIGERIDANLMNMDMSRLRDLDKDIFETKIDKIRAKTTGSLVIKEYPTASAHAGHFRALIEELRQKKGFKPHLIIVDYLGICASQRVRNTAANSYTILGSVAEELRSLGQEFDVPVLTAVQINRAGIESTDMDMTDTSDSMKIVHALDFYIGLIRTEELDELNQVLAKVLKNRYGSTNSKFVIGVDLGKSQWYNVESSAQTVSGAPKDDDVPAFDKTKFGKRINAEGFKF